MALLFFGLCRRVVPPIIRFIFTQTGVTGPFQKPKCHFVYFLDAHIRNHRKNVLLGIVFFGRGAPEETPTFRLTTAATASAVAAHDGIPPLPPSPLEIRRRPGRRLKIRVIPLAADNSTFHCLPCLRIEHHKCTFLVAPLSRVPRARPRQRTLSLGRKMGFWGPGRVTDGARPFHPRMVRKTHTALFLFHSLYPCASLTPSLAICLHFRLRRAFS